MGVQVPWAILMDPTSACNLKCIGCWAAEYGKHYNLTYEKMDEIIEQGKELGIYVYLFSPAASRSFVKDPDPPCGKAF